MVERGGAEGLLITGVYGSGKSSVAAEIADLLEKRGVPYAALDLDWLGWFDTGAEGAPSEYEMMLTNLVAVAGNFLAAGVRYFVLARSLRDTTELERLRAELRIPLKVVRLTVPLPEIRRRLSADVTAGRKDDLREAAEWIAAATGEGIEDLTISNEGPIRDVAERILDWLGWRGANS